MYCVHIHVYICIYVGVYEMLIMCIHMYIQYMHAMNMTHSLRIDTVCTYVPLAVEFHSCV